MDTILGHASEEDVGGRMVIAVVRTACIVRATGATGLTVHALLLPGEPGAAECCTLCTA